MATNAFTYDDGALREDLLDVLVNISPQETQLMSYLGTDKASSTRHEWLSDTLAAVKVNAFVEGADATQHTLTNPSRLFNYTQIFKQGFSVTDTERAVNTASFDDRYAYEASKAMKLLKNDMEYALMRGSLGCGSSSTARTLNGLKNILTLTTAPSGVSLSETMFNDYLQNVWDQGTEVNTVFAAMPLKRRVASWTGSATDKNVAVGDRRLVNAVEIYQADAAQMVKLYAHRYVSVSADTNYSMVGINDELFKVAYLRNPFSREIAKTSDSTRGEIVSEATLQYGNAYAGFQVNEVL